MSARDVYHNTKIFVCVFFQASGTSSSSKGEQQHHEPMVAMICPGKQGSDSRLFHNQYINPSDGKWTTDLDHKATCRQDKVEILEYCKKVNFINENLIYFEFHLIPLIIIFTSYLYLPYTKLCSGLSRSRYQQHRWIEPLCKNQQLV